MTTPTTARLRGTHLIWPSRTSTTSSRNQCGGLVGAERARLSGNSVELTIKSMLGKLTVPHDLSKKLPGQGVELLSVTAEHAEAIREFPELIRHDPFDRLIVAQASRAGLQLLTADHVLLDLHRDFIIDASR